MFKFLKFIILLGVFLVGSVLYLLFQTTKPLEWRYKQVPTAADSGAISSIFKAVTGASAPKVYEKRMGFIPGPDYLLIKTDEAGKVIEEKVLSEDEVEVIRTGSDILGGGTK